MLDRKEDTLTEKQDELNTLLAKLTKLEGSYKAEKAAGNERVQQMTAEALAAHKEVERVRENMKQVCVLV